MGHMFETDHFMIECGTCLATGTTACNECLVTHLLANDDGPIDFVTVAVARPVTATDRAIELFRRAGLLDDPVEYVTLEEFEARASEVASAVP
jgi:hypothetical protein